MKIVDRVKDMLTGFQEDIQRVTRILWWFTLGSLSTMHFVAPDAPLTKQLLPLEVGLLLGMGLMYIGKQRKPEHRRILDPRPVEDDYR